LAAAPGTRGDGAVDLQSDRNEAAHIASGEFSVLIGGRRNQAISSHSTVINGYGNAANASYALLGNGINNQVTVTGNSYSTILNGTNNQVKKGVGTILSGDNNVVDGSNSSILHGNGNLVSTNYSVVLNGNQALARSQRTTLIAPAAGFNNVLGSCQTGYYMLRGISSGTTAVRLCSDGAATAALENQLLVSGAATGVAGYVISGIIQVHGVLNGGGSVGHAVRRFSLKNIGGTTSEVYGLTTPSVVGTDSLPAGWTVTLSADNSLDCLNVSCVGATGQTVRWVAYIEYIETAIST
jgi:hypothetical protein